MKIAKHLTITGTVQGVGFRPFLYRLAKTYQLTGSVTNQTDGACLHIEGEHDQVEGFIHHIKPLAPVLAHIEQILIKDAPPQGHQDFKILPSRAKEQGMTFIPTDVATCEDCLMEFKSSSNKHRFNYPFTNCTNCGPRFTIIKSLPYDRKLTTMHPFPMCSHCQDEYQDVFNRRFHAQPTCCVACGPQYQFQKSTGETIETNHVFASIRSELKAGKIIAFKGIGGYQLICDAQNATSVQTLRIRKNRPTKPLAIMMKNLQTIHSYCQVNERESLALTSPNKPIVLLKKHHNSLLSHLSLTQTLGVMLPYTLAHELLFDEELTVLVVTSGNISGLPIIYKENDAFRYLNQVTDLFLTHNRGIENPIDDSIIRIVDDKPYMLRKARGYTPAYLKTEHLTNGLVACGGMLKTSFSFSNEGYLIQSPYIGSLSTEQTKTRFLHHFHFFKTLYKLNVQYLIHDFHPDVWIPTISHTKTMGVYHHHAHIVSCLVEHDVHDAVIGLAFDGTGYGADQKSWGSEFLISNRHSFLRVGHLSYFKLPGGDMATKQPWKIALSLLKQTYGDSWQSVATDDLLAQPCHIIEQMITRNMNCFETCSLGRLFDAIAVLLGFSGDVSYEGEAAIYVETLASKCQVEVNPYVLATEFVQEQYLIKVESFVIAIIEDLKRQTPFEIIAMKVHQTIIEISVWICERLRSSFQLNQVALSGGVFQNMILLEGLKKALEKRSFIVWTHQNIPCHDEGISVGQLIIANELLKKGAVGCVSPLPDKLLS